MKEKDERRVMSMCDLMLRALKLCEAHDLMCKCPESKLRHSIISTVARLEMLETRLTKAEKKKFARINCGVNPPCIKTGQNS